MIKGEDALDTSSCKAMKPFSGYDPDKFMVIVKNPNYDPSTDSSDVRSNNLDGVVITIDTNTDDIFNKIESGDLDGSWASLPPKTLEAKYTTDPSLKQYFHADSGDRTWYITMNLLVPPFDDVHVRKAVNFVIDKSAVQRAWGGSLHGQIATSVEPPTVPRGELALWGIAAGTLLIVVIGGGVTWFTWRLRRGAPPPVVVS